MSGFLQIPEAALACALSPEEEIGVFRLYQMADGEHFAAFRAPTRLLQQRTGLSARRVQDLLHALAAEGLVEIVSDGGPRASRTIRVLRWAEWRNADQAGEVADPAPSATPVLRNAGGNAGRNARKPAPAPVVEQPRNAGGNAGGNAIRARVSSTDPRPQGATPPQTPPGPDGPGGAPAPTQQPLAPPAPAAAPPAPDPWAGISTRAANALQAGGVATPEALASHSRASLRKLPGVGASTIAEAEAWLQQRNLALRPDPPKRAGPCGDPRAQVAGDAWKRAHVAVLGREPGWRWTPTGDPKHLVELAETFRVKPDHDADTAEVQLFERACRLYVRAADAGEAWPHGEPPALRHLARDGPQWLERARNPVTRRPTTNRKPLALDDYDDLFDELTQEIHHAPASPVPSDPPPHQSRLPAPPRQRGEGGA